MSAGTVRVGEVILHINGLRIEAGQIVVTTYDLGPIPSDSGPVRIFGPDGVPVTELNNNGNIELKRIRAGQDLRMTFAMRVGSVIGPDKVAWS